MRLDKLMDPAKLAAHILGGYVSAMQHPRHPNLWIYNYTHQAQFDNKWDDVTEHCRGLITLGGMHEYNSDTLENRLSAQEVIARPFRKFFNLNTSFRPETQEAALPLDKPRVMEKLDGSLGILYWYEGKPSIATRGSFASDQAKWATNWYREYVWREAHWPEGYTPLFEIIYKENRIVVDYSFEGLVPLGLVNVESGVELPPEMVAYYAAHNHLRAPEEYNLSLEDTKKYVRSNTEGFVLQYWSGPDKPPLRLKVKTEEYIRLHKIITGLNPKGVWEHLMTGGSPEALWWGAVTNKEFVNWCQGWINTFQRLHGKLESEATLAFGRACIVARARMAQTQQVLDDRATRKYHALAIQQEPSSLQSTLFQMYRGGDWKKEIWKQLEPKIEGKEAFIKNADEFNGL